MAFDKKASASQLNVGHRDFFPQKCLEKNTFIQQVDEYLFYQTSFLKSLPWCGNAESF